MKYPSFRESVGLIITLLLPCKGLILLGSFMRSPMLFYLHSFFYPLAIIVLLITCFLLAKRTFNESPSRKGYLISIIVLFLGGCIWAPWPVVQSYALKKVVKSNIDVDVLHQWLVDFNVDEKRTTKSPIVVIGLQKAEIPYSVKQLHPRQAYITSTPDSRTLTIDWGGRGFGIWELVISTSPNPQESGRSIFIIKPGVYVTARNNMEM